LLVVLCGSCTRLVRFLHGLDKTYEARIELGRETDTLDPEGRIVATAAVPDRASIESALPSFLGEIAQVPPAYSALHMGGRRAYEIARSGEAPEMRSRTVRIHELAILDYHPPYLDVRLRCSGGTYVRSLARDLARHAGSCASLAALRRTAIGTIGVEDAVSPESFLPERDLAEAGAFLARHGVLGTVTVREEFLGRLRHGRGGPVHEICSSGATPGEVACLDAAGRLVAIALLADEELRHVSAVGVGR